MLNTDTEVAALPSVIDYADPVVAERMQHGRMNTGEAQLLTNVAHAIRQGHPQMRTGPVRPEQVCLVGSGPSLDGTEDELRQLVWQGAQLVTMNGGYAWCLSHGLQPKTQIVMDARPSNAKFVDPAVPDCRYVLASQCDPSVWAAVAGRRHVWIWHAVVKQEGALSDLLDTYYGGRWIGIGGGTTVATRALTLLRTAGYVRFHLFGVDCCWRGDQHHAIDQPENDRDGRCVVRFGVTGQEATRAFTVSTWHLKQFEDCLTTFHVNGQHFLVEVHGDGMLAHAMRVLGTEGAYATVTKE